MIVKGYHGPSIALSFAVSHTGIALMDGNERESAVALPAFVPWGLMAMHPVVVRDGCAHGE